MYECKKYGEVAAAVGSAVDRLRGSGTPSWSFKPRVAVVDVDHRPLFATSPTAAPGLVGRARHLEDFFRSDWGADDVALSNDPDAGAANGCDFAVVRRVRQASGNASWVVCGGYVPDFGGWCMGGTSVSAIDRWAETGRIQAAMVRVDGRPRRDITELLALNTRTPKLNARMLDGLVDASAAIATKLEAMGEDRLVDELAQARSAEQEYLGAAFAEARNGAFEAATEIAAPAGEEKLGILGVAVRIDGKRATIAVTAPPLSRHPFNLGRHACEEIVLAAFAHAVGISNGMTDALSDSLAIEVQEPSLAFATAPSAVALGRVTTGRALFLAVFDCLRQARITASSPAELWEEYARRDLMDGIDPVLGRLPDEIVREIAREEAEAA